MKLSLYQIEQTHLQLVENLIENGGELTEEMEAALQLNEQDLTTKGTNYGFIIKQLTGECNIIDGEIDRLTALKKSRTKTIEKLKNALIVAMDLFEKEKIESPVMSISYRKSEETVIDDINSLPPSYVTIKQTFTADKTAIKNAIKAGAEIKGAHLQVNKNIQIK